MEDSENALSLGQLEKDGFRFTWERLEDPELIAPWGAVVPLEIADRVPTLILDDASLPAVLVARAIRWAIANGVLNALVAKKRSRRNKNDSKVRTELQSGVTYHVEEYLPRGCEALPGGRPEARRVRDRGAEQEAQEAWG